jgi:hypothetical protein
VPAMCPMGRSPGVLHVHSRTSENGCPPVASLVSRIPALIPKLIVRWAWPKWAAIGGGAML